MDLVQAVLAAREEFRGRVDVAVVGGGMVGIAMLFVATNAHELAQSVVFESGIQHFADGVMTLTINRPDKRNAADTSSQPISTSLAMEQWTALKETYERLGHRVETIDPQPGLPDMVFSANSGTVVDGQVLGSRFRAPQRAAEADHFRRWFLANGYRDVVMPERTNEAEGDFTWTGRYLLAGTGFRTDPLAHSEAQDDASQRRAFALALDWARAFPALDTPSPFAWYDMAVGLRAQRLAYVLDAGTRRKLLKKAQADTPIAPGESTLTVDLDVVFELGK